MRTYDDLDTYNGDTTHNMWVGLNSFENTDFPDVFNEPDLDNYIDDLNN